MRRKKSVFNLNLSSLMPYLPFIAFAALFVVGVLTGNLLVGRFSQLTDGCVSALDEFILVRRDFDFYQALKNSVSSVFPLYIVLFLCGTSVIGCVATPLVLITFGFFYGCLSGYLCFTYELEGIMFNALLLIPYTLIAAFGLIMLAKESFSFSYLLAGTCIKANKPVNIYSDFRSYCSHSLITAAVAVISVAFDMGMSSLFIGFFDF